MKSLPFYLICFVMLHSLAGFALIHSNAANATTQEISLNPVNINTASAEVLANTLKGIGEKKAQAIIMYREKHGDFTQITDLAKVKGISLTMVEELKPLLTL